MSMTFEAFKATQRVSADLAVDLPDHGFEGVTPGLIYDDGFWIETRADTWTRPGRYQLILYNECYLDDDLDRLERLLYEFVGTECS